MSITLKPFIIFIIVLAVVWMGFVALVVLFKNKTGRKLKDIRNFKDEYKDLDDVIAKKKEEVQKEKQ